MKSLYLIPEVELSINNKCNLQCKECGFLIPHQTYPTKGKDIIQEHLESLRILEKNDIGIGSLAILGGEPTLDRRNLENAIMTFSSLKNIGQLEIVTNGLNPKGISDVVLSKTDKISVSVYLDDKNFISGWKEYIAQKAPHIQIEFRVQREWDINSGNHIVSHEVAQKMFDDCWYRKHCVTIERSRIFLCSPAAKHKSDSDGLFLDDRTTREAIILYLQKTSCLEQCKKCIPQMNLGKVQGGIQSNGKIDVPKMVRRTLEYFDTILSKEYKEKSLEKYT